MAKEYAQARELVLKHKDEFALEIFHYNLGTLYLKEKQFPAARYHFEKALHLGLVDARLKKNLNTTIKGLSISTPELSFKDQFIETASSLSLGGLTSVSLTLLLIWALFSRFIAKRFGRALLILSFCFCLLPFAGRFYLQNLHKGVVLEDTWLREGPSKIYEQSGKIPGGTRVILGSFSQNWALVVSPTYYSGWVPVKDLGTI